MKRIRLLTGILFILIAVSIAVSVVLAQEEGKKETIADIAKSVLYKRARCGRGKLTVVNRIPVLHLYGTPGDMGKQYGTMLKKLLVALEGVLQEKFGSEDEVMLAKMMASEVEKFIPKEYVSEMKAISRATGIDYLSILLVNGLAETMQCSTIAVWGKRTRNGKILFGRNLGQTVLPEISDKIACVTVYHPKGKNAFAAVGVAGLIGAYSAINEKGLSLANTTSVNAKQAKTFQGIPTGLLYRHLLENCATVKEARKELKKLKHNPMRASTLMICDAKNNAVVVELGPDGVAFREPKDEIIYATNHFLTKKMKKEDVPCWRYKEFEKVEKKNEKINVPAMKKILLEVVQKGVTLQTIIFEPAAKKMHIAFHKHGKPAARTRYSILALKHLFPEVLKRQLNKQTEELMKKLENERKKK